jgi:RNA polymerase sigma-70 factor (ECF subfamily)
MSDSLADFEKTYREYYAEIRRFIFTIARQDQDITDDISQNTWQNAYNYFGSLRDASSVRPWLYAIARNEAKRYFANKHTVFFSNVMALEDEDETISVISEGDSEFPEALANQDLLLELMETLTGEEQRLIILHYAYDINLKDIADMEGINYNTLKSTYRRTMGKLQKAGSEMESYKS